MPYGYEYGNPFGDPNKFTRSTQESEIDRFNQWMRSQPYWQQIAAQNGGKDWSDQQASELSRQLAAQGIQVPENFHIDEGGNFNQKSRVKRNLAIAGIIGGTALGGLGLAGMGPLGGVLGGAGAAGGATATGASINAAGLGGMTSLAGTSALPGLAPSIITGLTTPGVGAVATSTGLGGGGAAASGGGSWLSKLLHGGKKIIGGDEEGEGGQGLADMSSMFGGLGNAETLSRFKKGDLTQGYDRLNIQASEENRNRENDALKNLARTSYITGGGASALPTRVNSGNLPDLGFGPKPASDAQKQGASTLQQSLLQRLTPEGQIKPTAPDYLNSGKLENVGKYGGIATGALGAVKNIFGWGK